MREFMGKAFSYLDEEQKKKFEEKRREVSSYVEDYEIKKGDTLSNIAEKSGITLDELLLFNDILGKDFRKNKNGHIVLRVGETIFIPNKASIEKFREDIDEIKSWEDMVLANVYLFSEEFKEYKNQIITFFKTRPQPLSLSEVFQALLNNQSFEFDPNHPPFLDRGFRDVKARGKPLCLSALRAFLRCVFGIADSSKRQDYPYVSDEVWDFLTKEKMDAWMLGEEAKRIGFQQKFNFMEFFDRSQILGKDPIPDSRKREYRNKIMELYQYVKDHPNEVRGSFLPYFFVNSHAKPDMWAYNMNLSRLQQHLNTHQTMPAGNGTMIFEAQTLGEGIESKLEESERTRDSMKYSIKILNKQLESNNKYLGLRGKNIDDYLNLQIPSQLIDKLNEFDKTIEIAFPSKKTLSKKIFIEESSKESNIDVLLKKISKRFIDNGFFSDNPELMKAGSEGLKQLLYPIVIACKKTQDLQRNIEKFKLYWSSIKKSDKEIDMDAYGSLLDIDEFADKVQAYNALITQGNKIKKDIKEKEDIISDLSQDISQKTKEIKQKEQEIHSLQIKISEAKNTLPGSRKKILEEFIAFGNSPVYREYNSFLDTYFDQKVEKFSKDKSNIDQYKKDFINAVFAKDTSKIYNVLINIGYKAGDREISNLVTRGEGIKKAQESFAMMQDYLNTLGDNQLIDLKLFTGIFANTDKLNNIIKEYNKNLTNINNLEDTLNQKKEVGHSGKIYNVIDYIVKFIQARADFKGSQDEGFRADTLAGLERWPNMIDITVNGEKVDIKKELEKRKNKSPDCLSIKPTDKIEITGPMQIDAELQPLHKNEKRHLLSIRTRFLFEFLICQRYLPTELLIPSKNTIFKKENFDPNTKGLKKKYEYYLEKDQSLEIVLKEQIIKYENLDPNAPDFERKVNEHYALQIKGLQMIGLLQSESKINPGALKTYSGIPYFDVSNIDEIYGTYLYNRQREILDKTRESVIMKTFISITTIEGDTDISIFNRLLAYMDLYSESSNRYPNFAYAKTFNKYQKRIFLKKVLDTSRKSTNISSSEDFLNNLRPGFIFTIKNNDLVKIIDEVCKISHIEKSQTNKVGDIVIDKLIPTAQLNNLARMSWNLEIGGGSRRLFIKKGLEKHGKVFGDKYGDSHPRSVGDAQLRFSDELLLPDEVFKKKSDIDKWLNKDTLFEAFANVERLVTLFRDPKSASEYPDLYKQFTQDEKFKTRLIYEEEIIEKIKAILEKGDIKELSLDERKELNIHLRSLLKIDDGTGYNIVGKIIGYTLLPYKLNSHALSIEGWLREAGYKNQIHSIYDNPEYMERYEKYILFINNQSESTALMALAENYIIRILTKGMGVTLQTKSVLFEDRPALQELQNAFPSLSSESISRDPVDVFGKKIPIKPNFNTGLRNYITEDAYRILKNKVWNGFVNSQTDYGKSIFIQNLDSYIKQVVKSNHELSNMDKKVLEKLSKFSIDYRTTKDKSTPIYGLLGDVEIINYLKSKKVDSFPLPSDKEIYETTFQITMFNVHKKIDGVSSSSKTNQINNFSNKTVAQK